MVRWRVGCMHKHTYTQPVGILNTRTVQPSCHSAIMLPILVAAAYWSSYSLRNTATGSSEASMENTHVLWSSPVMMSM